MQSQSLTQLIASKDVIKSTGPIALLFVEDTVCINETIEHHTKIGFQTILVFGSNAMKPDTKIENCIWVDTALNSNHSVIEIINKLIHTLPNRWIYYSFNAEFLYFPFCETRKISDFTGFLDEEKRVAAFSTTVDLYTNTIKRDPSDFEPDSAMLDSLGYYAQTRNDAFGPKPRQIDVFGGLRWRFEEYIPWDRRRINTVRLFKTSTDLKLGDDFIFNRPEYETFQSEWHNSPSIAVCSFRAAKFLLDNPGSRETVQKFDWPNSVKYQASAEQLLEMGLMEPGQWF